MEFNDYLSEALGDSQECYTSKKRLSDMKSQGATKLKAVGKIGAASSLLKGTK